MINTIFHFVNDPTFDYQTAVNNGDISEYTIVFNSADHSIHCKGTMFGRMSRADMVETLGNISDLIPVATDSTLGGIKIGYTNNADLNSRRYGVVLDDNNKAYVEVPWTDTITPEFDDTELRNIVATERGRIDNFISTLSSTIDAKNRELYADGDWVREIFGNAQDPGSVAAAYRKELDDYLLLFDVWEYIDPEHPELGRKARIVELLNTEDGLTHRMGEAETSISGNSATISTLTHDLSGLSSTVTTISDDLDTVTRKESALEQTVDSIGLRVTSSEGDISTLQTQEASLQVQADKIQSRVVATENSINGCYKIAIVLNPSNAASAVDVSTISAAVAARTSLSNNQLINDEDFTTAPTENTLYKNSVPQYFTFSRYKGLTVRATEIEQTADSITLRVGAVEGDTDSLTTRTSTLEQTADSLSTRVGAVEDKADGIDMTLSSFEQTVNTEISGIKTAQTNLSSSVSSYETTNDDNIGNLIKMAAAVLDLKASSDAEGNLSTTTDLANVITSEGFTGYSGLSQRVLLTESGILANADLIADVQGTINGLDIDGKVTRATAGLASETWVGLHYDTKGSADTAEANAKGYADDIVAGAKADVIASIDDTVAGMSVLVTKDSSGYIDSNIYLKANQIYLDGLTNFKTAVGAFVKTDVLEAGTATIDAATIDAATINSANITGTLSGVDGTFSGDVYANLFRAGSENGFNITVNSDSIDFNYSGSRQAWFTTKKYEMNTNGEIVDSGNDASQGFYLYMISPKNGNLVTIDFDNLKFSEVTNANLVLIPTHTMTIKTLTVGNGGLVSLGNRTIYYQNLDANGNSITNRYFWNSECTNEITSGSLGNNCYVLNKTGFCIMSETVTSGSSTVGDKALRDVEIYKPAYLPPNTGMIVGNGSSVYIVKKNNNYYAVRCTNTSSYTVYNSGVYYNANPSSPLSNMSVNLKLSSDSSGISAYLGEYSGFSGLPTHVTGAKLSIFTVSGSSTPLTKVDYTIS